MSTAINSGQTLISPIKGPSTVFAFLFIASGILHAWQSRKYRSWSFTWPLPFACLLMTAGFICREYSAFNPKGEDLSSVIEGVFYSATPTFALPLYLFFIRILVSNPNVIGISPTVLFYTVSIFNTAIITCAAQGASQYFVTTDHTTSYASALALVKSSLLLQLALNAAYLWVLNMFQFKRKDKSTDEKTTMAYVIQFALMLFLVILNIFRTVQIFVAPSSALWTEEAYFWIFEALVTLAYTASFHIMHPAKYLVVKCRSEE